MWVAKGLLLRPYSAVGEILLLFNCVPGWMGEHSVLRGTPRNQEKPSDGDDAVTHFCPSRAVTKKGTASFARGSV